MTEFQGKELAETNSQESKKETKSVLIPESRVLSDEKIWMGAASEFVDMLSYCRPAGSKTERKFIAKFIIPLGVTFDKKGNYYKRVGVNPTILWSSHTDTVHSIQGYQKIQYWQDKRNDVHFEVNHKKTIGRKSSCLGADDTAGIWLMIEMIRANIPGLYIFHRAEEIGCLGSKHIAENNKDALKNIKFAIAFDRRDEKSIITHQMSHRCCSDEFAESLAAQLGMGHEKDTTGSTTDTRSYVDLIAECTNISVGYNNAHSSTENVNFDYLYRLRDAILKIDISKLVEKRKPGENTYLSRWAGGRSYGNYGGYYDADWHQDSIWSNTKSTHKKEDGVASTDLRKKYGTMDAWMEDYEWDYKFGLWFKKGAKTDEVDPAKKV